MIIITIVIFNIIVIFIIIFIIIYPKNKLLLYNRCVISKISWHFTVANLSRTWVTETIVSVVNKFLRIWLEIPVPGILSNMFLARNKFCFNILLPSVKFIQCQTACRNALKTSQNDSIKQPWNSTSHHTNIQYDRYTWTRDFLREFHSEQEDKLQYNLLYQGSFFLHVKKFSLSRLNALWSVAQSKLPQNIFNFSIRYINNFLPTKKNFAKWGVTASRECSFCLSSEALVHVVAGCQSYLERST